MDEYDDYEAEDDSEEYEYEFKLVDTDDPMTLILVCVSSRPMAPDEYAQALMAYAQQVSGKINMSDLRRETMN